MALILEASNLSEVTRGLQSAHQRGEKIESVRLSAMNRILEHAPEDMTASVEAGLMFAQLQSALAARGQWLPLDPPHPDRLSIGALLSTNASGPRRCGYGTVRDYLIGIKVVLADGRLIKAGGKVVKNVAGYDLCKLFIGDQGSLGVIVEATFKLTPIPQAEQFLAAHCESLEKVGTFIESVLASDLNPVVLDAHNRSILTLPSAAPFTVVLGFAGVREDVDHQVAEATALGAHGPSNLDHETAFWADGSAGPVRRVSVPPSELVAAARGLGTVPWVARAGNGLLCYRGGPEPVRTKSPVKLARRVKETFDPKNILPEPPL